MPAQIASASSSDKQALFDFTTGEPVAGTFSRLVRSHGTVATQVRARVTPGAAATAWYVVFNNPSACSDECGEDDLFTEDGLNVEQIAAARISVVYGGDGAVANPAGRVALNGGLAQGEIPSGAGQVLIGRDEDGALVEGVGVVTGLEDARAAEIHIVLQEHGPAHNDAGLLDQQLTQFEGACNPVCADVQFAVHLP